jgi:hypothetical protein
MARQRHPRGLLQYDSRRYTERRLQTKIVGYYGELQTHQHGRYRISLCCESTELSLAYDETCWSRRLQCNALAVHVINNFQFSSVQEDYTEHIWCGRLQLSWTGNAVACHRDGFKIVKLFEKHRNAAIRWFQNDTYEIMDNRE